MKTQPDLRAIDYKNGGAPARWIASAYYKKQSLPTAEPSNYENENINENAKRNEKQTTILETKLILKKQSKNRNEN